MVDIKNPLKTMSALITACSLMLGSPTIANSQEKLCKTLGDNTNTIFISKKTADSLYQTIIKPDLLSYNHTPSTEEKINHIHITTDNLDKIGAGLQGQHRADTIRIHNIMESHQKAIYTIFHEGFHIDALHKNENNQAAYNTLPIDSIRHTMPKKELVYTIKINQNYLKKIQRKITNKTPKKHPYKLLEKTYLNNISVHQTALDKLETGKAFLPGKEFSSEKDEYHTYITSNAEIYARSKYLLHYVFKKYNTKPSAISKEIINLLWKDDEYFDKYFLCILNGDEDAFFDYFNKITPTIL